MLADEITWSTGHLCLINQGLPYTTMEEVGVVSQQLRYATVLEQAARTGSSVELGMRHSCHYSD